MQTETGVNWLIIDCPELSYIYLTTHVAGETISTTVERDSGLNFYKIKHQSHYDLEIAASGKWIVFYLYDKR